MSDRSELADIEDAVFAYILGEGDLRDLQLYLIRLRDELPRTEQQRRALIKKLLNETERNK